MRSSLLLTLAAILSSVSLSHTAQTQSGASNCVRRSRRPGHKSILEENIEAVFGTGDASADDVSVVATADGQCECVPFHLCDNGTIITDGRGVIDVRLGPGLACEDVLEVCCESEDRVKTTLPSPPAPIGCGQRNTDGLAMHITGNTAGEAQFAEFPWMAALLDIQDGVEMFVGGGSLIHPAVVLTAAHTVAKFLSDPTFLRVRLGEWDTQSGSEPLPYQQLAVKEVVMHERYYRGALHNDVALLILRDPAIMAGNVATLCLPEQDEVVEDTTCVATGWGMDEFGAAGCYQVILKSLELPVVPRDACERMLRVTRLGGRFMLHRSALCAGGEEGVDACRGDGGGPLACPWTDRKGETFYRQIGIISWGIGCGVANVPGVYTDVAWFRRWIDERFAERRLDSSTYRRL